MNLNRVARQIDKPNFLDSRFGVVRDLDLTIKIDRPFGDFDDQKNIPRARVSRRIEVGAWVEQSDVRLRFGVIVEADGILNTHHDRPRQTRAAEVMQAVNTRRVTSANR